MRIVRATSGRAKTLSLVLIVSIGLLNFHIPHFLIEQPTSVIDGSAALELVFVGNLVGALVAAVGIYLEKRWGWLLGMVIVTTSVVLYLAQETVGLPGLPKAWLEPSRIVALIIEALFFVVARYQVNAARRRAPA